MSTVLARRDSVQRGIHRLYKFPTLTPLTLHSMLVASRKSAAEARDKLKPGIYDVSEMVKITGKLTVGQDSETSATVTPDANELLAVVLSKLPEESRDKLLRELPQEFARRGTMPRVDAKLVEQAETLCQSLRRKVTQTRRGTVTGKLSIQMMGDIDAC